MLIRGKNKGRTACYIAREASSRQVYLCPMTLEQALREKVAKAVRELAGTEVADQAIRIEHTNPDFTGDYTVVVFPLAKIMKQSPDVCANAIGNYLKEQAAEIAGFNVVKGFLNLELKDEVWTSYLREIWNDAAPGKAKPGSAAKVMVEYSSPNTNKPLHLGHVRNILLGWSVAEILEYTGHEVIKANLINDRGIHICKSMLAWLKYGQGETPAQAGMKGDHLAGKYYVLFDVHYKEEVKNLIAGGLSEEEAEKKAPLMLEAQEMLRRWEAGDEATLQLWRTMNGWVYEGFESTYRRLGVDFDKYYYESDTYTLGKDLIQDGLERGVFYRKDDGSVWIDLSAEGLDQKLVLRSDGTSVYITQDIGTAQLKADEFGISRSIYVVGNEQDYHFKVLKCIMEKLGKSYAAGIYHLSYGMVDLPSGKMKSREGTVVDADDLISDMVEAARLKTEELGKTEGLNAAELDKLYETLGLAALKFFILKVDPKKRMLFNPEESIDFQGDTGPFVQYTFARIRSMQRNLQEVVAFPEGHPVLSAPEKNVIRNLYGFKEAVAGATSAMDPSVIAQWCIGTSRAFNRMYNELPILKEADPKTRMWRLCLIQATANALACGMGLLGIECPEKM
jgi:arginyl-tRNA synthetase